MAIKNLENPIFHIDDPFTGGPLIGGKVYVYAAGTTDLITTWQDYDQTTANTNPVILDSYGNAKIWFAQDAKVVVKNSDDSITYYTFDDVSPVGGTSTVSGDYNLVQNGSFESAEIDSTPSQWTVTLNDPSSVIIVDTTNVSHGKQSLKIDGFAGAGGGNIVSQKFDVSVGEVLVTSLSTMASNATTTNDVQILWYKKDDTASATPSTTLALPAEGSYPTSMTSYTFLSTVPSDATRAEIKVIGIDSGGSNLDEIVYFDNIFCKVIEEGTGSKILIEEQIASASASIDFVTGIDSTYSQYEIEIINAVPVTDAVNMYLRISTDLGSSWVATGYYLGAGSATFLNLTATGAISNTAANGGANSSIKVSDPSNSGTVTTFRWNSSQAVTAGGVIYTGAVGGTYGTAIAVNGIQIYMSSGNIASGIFRLYGIK